MAKLNRTRHSAWFLHPSAGNLRSRVEAVPTGAKRALKAVGQGWVLQTAILENDQVTQFANRSQLNSWTHQFETDVTSASSRLIVGADTSGNRFAEMQVGAILIYDRALTDVQRKEVETYLINKYLSVQSPTLPPGRHGSCRIARRRYERNAEG